MDTKEATGFIKYGFDGEDFIEFDLKGQQWIALRKEALFLKKLWDADTADLLVNTHLITKQCSQFLNSALVSGNSTLLRTGQLSECTFSVGIMNSCFCPFKELSLNVHSPT